MKKSKFTESQIVSALKEYEAGKKVPDICRELGINQQTFYNWKKKYSGMDSELLRRFKELERENAELKKMYADISLDCAVLRNYTTFRKWNSYPQ